MIENKVSGSMLIQDLSSSGLYAITPYQPKCDKVMRMVSASSVIENGFVYIPESAPWLGEFEAELMAFPKGKFDDQADSVSQALDWIKQRESNDIAGRIIAIPRSAKSPAVANLPPAIALTKSPFGRVHSPAASGHATSAC